MNFAFLLTFGLFAPSLAKQSFDTEPANLEVNPGEVGILACRIFGKDRDSICHWQKDGLPIRMQAGKYEWSGNREQGDCSLRVLRADINFDNAEWVCQVSPSSFDADDALSSKPARIIVRIPPMAPRIYFNGQFLADDLNTKLQVTDGDVARLRCESRGGNPPAGLKWFLDDEELQGSSQKNETEIGDDRKWNAVSVIEITLTKAHHNKRLKCAAFHEAYSRRSLEQAAILDILYAPVVQLVREHGGHEFEADIDNIELKCIADANPKPQVFWRKAGGESILKLDEVLDFKPVREGDGGTYYCMAKNSVGSSDELSLTFEVLYPPRKVITQPTRLVDLEVGRSADFKCEADANPPPKYEWLQKLPDDFGQGQGRIYARGQGKSLRLKNVTYEYEGRWACVASNVIKGRERREQSEPISIEVTGRPQVLLFKTEATQWFSRHTDAEVKVNFCSDPKPTSLAWDWGSVQLLEGKIQNGRFKASQVQPDPNRKDCYLATLTIYDMISADSRIYSVTISNGRGDTKYGIDVRVSDPVPMAAIVGVIATAISLVLLIIFCVAYSYRAQKCCFKKKGPAFERDTNFRIYPNENYVAERLPAPPKLIDSRPLPKEQPLGIPTFNPSLVTMPRHPKDPKYASKESILPTVSTVRRPEPTYPLPPRSQFALRSHQQPSAFTSTTVARKTPQNVDISEALANYTENLILQQQQGSKDSDQSKFQAKLRSSTSSLPGGESMYYPRARDRADV